MILDAIIHILDKTNPLPLGCAVGWPKVARQRYRWPGQLTATEDARKRQQREWLVYTSTPAARVVRSPKQPLISIVAPPPMTIQDDERLVPLANSTRSMAF